MAELSNHFGWSWKRQQAFDECPRKLYWLQYGSWLGWEPDAARTAALGYRLSKIKNLGMLVGQTFHETLAAFLRKRDAAPGPVPTSLLSERMESSLLRRITESRKRDWERHGPKDNAILFEDYYGGGVTPDMRDRAIADLRACSSGLAADAYGRRVFVVRPDRLKFVDPQGQFGRKRVVLDNIIILAAPDLIVADDAGDLHIVDWKTGKKPARADLAQLAVYGLFVSEQFSTPIERISAHLVYVLAGARQTHEHLGAGAAQARRNIATYAADVQSRLTDVERNEAADMTRFEMTTNLATCARCNFKELCGR